LLHDSKACIRVSQADRRPGRFAALHLSRLEADELPNSGDP
jgi:hypothetical protein